MKEKGFIQTLKNIWSLDELREKIILTVSLVLVYRFASYIFKNFRKMEKAEEIL